MEKYESKYDGVDHRPSPSNFEVFLPWACIQLHVNVTVVISKIKQNEYVSVVTDRKPRGKSKASNSRMEVIDQDKDNKSVNTCAKPNDNILKINAIYDNFDNLVQLKFDKNKNVPRNVIYILGLIIKFHIYLNSIIINRGLDKYSVHEICKILPISRITDICLDGTFLLEANCYMLFEADIKLRQISLARCKLDDGVIRKIAENLPSSKTLAVLNLSSNRITDNGAKYLADALRTNRYLLYLNLADNMITDEGASAIFDTMMEFPITSNEILNSRMRHMIYLNKKNEMIAKILIDLKSGDDKKEFKKKSYKPSVPVKKSVKCLEKDISLKAVADANALISDAAFLERAEIIAVNTLGVFNDPFSITQTVSKDGTLYCHGNNMLSYLNLAYNNLSVFSLKKILNVLLYQKLLDRKPRGLINLCIDGNSFPVSCKELAEIDDLLEMGLTSLNQMLSSARKNRAVSRSVK